MKSRCITSVQKNSISEIIFYLERESTEYAYCPPRKTKFLKRIIPECIESAFSFCREESYPVKEFLNNHFKYFLKDNVLYIKSKVVISGTFGSFEIYFNSEEEAEEYYLNTIKSLDKLNPDNYFELC